MPKKTIVDATPLPDYRYDFPLAKRGEKKRAAKVWLTDAGFFKVVYPDEVIKMFARHRGAVDYAYGDTLGRATSNFDREIERYKNAIQTKDRKKVIVVKFLYNKPYNEGFGTFTQLQRGDHGHWNDGAGRYALALDYEVMFQIGNALWDVAEDAVDEEGNIYLEPQHRYGLPIADKAYHVLDWTEEREQFLSNMTYSLEGLIQRLNGFFGNNLLENMTLAIANGGGLAALPAPAPEAEIV